MWCQFKEMENTIYVMFVTKNKQLHTWSLNVSIYLDCGQELVKL